MLRMSLLLLLCVLVAAPVQRPADVVKWSAAPLATTITRGGVVKITVTADVQPGWKLYAIEQPANGPRPLSFDVPKNLAFDIERKHIATPAAKVQKDDNFDLETRYYEKQATFIVPVTVRRTAPAGRHTLPLEVTFQACGQSICLRPYTQKLELELSIAR